MMPLMLVLHVLSVSLCDDLGGQMGIYVCVCVVYICVCVHVPAGNTC